MAGGEQSSEVEMTKGIDQSAGSEDHVSDNEEHADEYEKGEAASDSSDRSRFELSSFQSKFSFEKLMEVIERLTDPQKKLVASCGFRSILDLKCRQLPYKQLIATLASHYDVQAECIKIPGTIPFKIDGQLVHWILGIPYGGHKIPRSAKQMTKNLIAEDTGTSGNLAPKIEDLNKLIVPELGGDKFVRIFMLLLLSIFLCPSSADRASCHYYNGITVVKNIKSFDWCDAVATCLNSGLSKFKKSCPNNKNPSLCGCLFVLYTAYFDLLGLDVGIDPPIPDTMPRIYAWDDDFVDKYMLRFPTFTKVEIKPLEATVFGKNSLKRKARRPPYVKPLNDVAACATNVAGPSTMHNPLKKQKKSTKDFSSTLVQENVEINRESVIRAFPSCPESDLRIFYGEELHPEVEKHISSLAGPTCSNEMIVALRRLCLSSSREKFMEYIQSAQPMLISHCFSLVTSFMSGAQLGSVQKLPPAPSMGIQPDTSRSQHAHSVGHISVQSNNCPEKNNDTEIRHASGSKEKGSSVNVKTIAAASIHHDSDGGGGAAASKNKIITEKDKKQGDDKTASVDCIDQLHDRGPLAVAIEQKKATSNPNVAASMLVDGKGGDSNDDDTSIACGEDKKNSLAQKELSALGHKKRALKQPPSVFENPMSSKVTVTDFEKNVFHIGTKRPIGIAQSIACVDIGRFFIDHGQFSNSMAGTRWVGTFAMNVFAEALNYDTKNSVEPLSVKKCYLSSSEVDHLIIDDIDINLLAKKLDARILGFNIAEMDMVFIPICYENHWWLVVANLRDDRFEILNSMRSHKSYNKITSIVCTNLTRFFDNKGLRGDDVVDLKDFTRPVHTVPQQQTSNDCGIYVMHFMSTWDGRQIPPIRPEDVYNLRVKFAAYMLTHRGNKKVLQDIKKLVDKEACGQKKKEKSK